MTNKNSRSRNLMILGAILMLVSFLFQGQTISVISATSPLTFDFNTGTSPWQLSKFGTGSMGTLTLINSNPNDPHARLTCTSYDPTGWFGAAYYFDADALNPGSSYTVTFWYLSDISFNFNYISRSASSSLVEHFNVICPASSTWVQKTLSVPAIQEASSYAISLSVYSPGNVNFDLVQVSLNGGTQPTITPTVTPTPTATPAPTPLITPSPTDPPQPTDAKVTLSGSGGGVIMRYNGLTLPCSPIASSVYYVPKGVTVTLTPTPSQGTSFDRWEINSEEYTNNPIQVTVNGDLAVQAFFTAAPTSNPSNPTPTAKPVINPIGSDIANYTTAMLYVGFALVGLGLVDFMLKRKAS